MLITSWIDGHTHILHFSFSGFVLVCILFHLLILCLDQCEMEIWAVPVISTQFESTSFERLTPLSDEHEVVHPARFFMHSAQSI